MTAGGGNFIRGEVIRNKRSVRWTALPRAVRENCDYSSAVRVRNKTPIENAEGSNVCTSYFP